MNEELLDGYVYGKLHGDQLLMVKRVAVAQPGNVIQMGYVIEQIIARDNLKRALSPPTRMSPFPTPQRARPSGINAYLQLFRHRVDSSNED